MKQILKDELLKLKIYSKSNYLKVNVLNNQNIIDNIAKEVSTDADIIELYTETSDDKFFLKIAEETKLLCAEFNKTFIINSRADIAYLSHADGIFLNKNDLDNNSAKKLLGDDIIIGRYDSDTQEADYKLSDNNTIQKNIISSYKLDETTQNPTNYIYYLK